MQARKVLVTCAIDVPPRAFYETCVIDADHPTARFLLDLGHAAVPAETDEELLTEWFDPSWNAVHIDAFVEIVKALQWDRAGSPFENIVLVAPDKVVRFHDSVLSISLVPTDTVRRDQAWMRWISEAPESVLEGLSLD
jgi:hypothetical protein